MTDYSINIAMSQTTVSALQNGGYYLYGFKGVQTSIGGGAPLVWFNTQTYSLATDIAWQEQYQAYTSNSTIVPNGQITASAAYDIDLGQTLQVTGQAGTGEVVQGGTSTAITILNQTQPPKQFTCGASQIQNVNGAPTATPLCAFPLYGTGMDLMAPIELVLLMFATADINTGTVIYKAFSQGVLVNLTGESSRSVNFDINAGWSWGGGAWGQVVPPNAELAPLLIDSSNALALRGISAMNVGPRAEAPVEAPHSKNGAKTRARAEA